MSAGWLKGTLPSWLILLMIVIISFGAKHYFDGLERDRSDFKKTLIDHNTVILVTQGKLAVVEGKVGVLERGQDLMLQELRGIREELQRRK